MFVTVTDLRNSIQSDNFNVTENHGEVWSTNYHTELVDLLGDESTVME